MCPIENIGFKAMDVLPVFPWRCTETEERRTIVSGKHSVKNTICYACRAAGISWLRDTERMRPRPGNADECAGSVTPAVRFSRRPPFSPARCTAPVRNNVSRSLPRKQVRSILFLPLGFEAFFLTIQPGARRFFVMLRVVYGKSQSSLSQRCRGSVRERHFLCHGRFRRHGSSRMSG